MYDWKELDRRAGAALQLVAAKMREVAQAIREAVTSGPPLAYLLPDTSAEAAARIEEIKASSYTPAQKQFALQLLTSRHAMLVLREGTEERARNAHAQRQYNLREELRHPRPVVHPVTLGGLG